MKYLVTLFFLVTSLARSNAQQSDSASSQLTFNSRYTQCERKWVVLPRSEADRSYIFGFVYVDAQAGFTFDLKGNFSIGPDGRYIPDTSITKGTSIKYRIQPGHYQHLALIPSQHFTELGIKAEPDWINAYYTYTDTVAHDYRWGWIYNDLGESGIALTYLEPAYQKQPHAKGVEFELGFAYNVVGRYDDAVKVLTLAIANNPDNAYFYKELGYAHTHKNEYKEAIEAYKLGLQHFPDKVDESRGELAFNMAQAYQKLGDADNYKSWMIKAKSFTPSSSQFYKYIIDAGF